MTAPDPPPVSVIVRERARVPHALAWPSASRRRRPLVLVLPGLDMEPRTLIPWLVELAQGGVVAASVWRRIVTGRGEPPALAGGLPGIVNQLRNESMLLLGEIDGVHGADPAEHLGLIGVSAGGWAALDAAEADARVRAVAAVLCGAGPEDLSGGPQARARRLSGRPVMLVAGGRDPVAPVSEVRHFYEALVEARTGGTPPGHELQLVVYPGLDHRLTGPMERRVSSWMIWMLDARGKRG